MKFLLKHALAIGLAIVVETIVFLQPRASQAAVEEEDSYILLVPTGLSSIANHLNNGGNTFAELLSEPPEGTLFYKFDTDRQIYTLRYVEPVVVAVPGVTVGQTATIQLQVFKGTSWETATTKGQFGRVDVYLGGQYIPPGNLAGLTGITIRTAPPQITQQPASATVAAGAEVMFSVSAMYTRHVIDFWNATYQWRKNATDLFGQTSETLLLSNVGASDAASYTVKISNLAGSVTSLPAVLSLLSIDMYPGLTIVGPVGARYRIDYALEADSESWQPLGEIVLPSSPYIYSDTSEPARNKRFYRAALITSE